MVRPSEMLGRVPGLTDGSAADLYRRNGFRVLGLPVRATPSEILKRKQSLERRLRVGIPVSDVPGLAGPVAIELTEDVLGEAVQRLSDPLLRLVDEVLWFWGADPELGSPECLRAIQSFLDGKKEAAIKEWEAIAGGSGPGRFAARHDLAVAVHMSALEGCDAGKGPPPDVMGFWKAAATAWAEACSNGCVHVANWLEQRVAAIGDPRYSRQLAREITAAVPALVAASMARQAQVWGKSGAAEPGRQLADWLRNSGLTEDAKTEGIATVASPIRRAVEQRTRAARECLGAGPAACLRAAITLAEEGGLLLGDLGGLLDPTDATSVTLGDEVSEAVVMLQVRYGKATKDWHRSEKLLVMAKRFARGEQQRQRVDKELETIRGLQKDEGGWRINKPLPADFEEKVVTLIAGAIESGSFDQALRSLEEQRDVEPLKPPDYLDALYQAWLHLLGQRGMAAFIRASRILSEETPVIANLRKRRRADAPYGRLGELLSLAGWCAACGLPAIRLAQGEGAIVTIDGAQSRICSSCVREHNARVQDDNAKAKPDIAGALCDLTVVGEADPQLWLEEWPHLRKRANAVSVNVHADARLVELRLQRKLWRRRLSRSLNPDRKWWQFWR